MKTKWVSKSKSQKMIKMLLSKTNRLSKKLLSKTDSTPTTCSPTKTRTPKRTKTKTNPSLMRTKTCRVRKRRINRIKQRLLKARPAKTLTNHHLKTRMKVSTLKQTNSWDSRPKRPKNLLKKRSPRWTWTRSKELSLLKRFILKKATLKLMTKFLT